MHNAPRQKLRELIIEYGRSLCDNPRRCEALLKDYCGQHKREIFVLVSALKNRVAEDLIKTSANVPQSVLFARLNQRLEDELAMTAEAAHWVVESWALALGIISQPLPVMKSAPVSLPLAPTSVPKVAPAPQARPAETLMAGRYRDNGDGTVTDVKTGLQWMRFSLGQKWKDGTCMGEAKQYPWREALDAAEALNCQGGYAGCLDWRLPTKKELQTLVAGKSSPTIDRAAFPNTLGWWYWSSSSDAGDPHYALVVDFSSGVVYADYRASNGRVRLVHGGQ